MAGKRGHRIIDKTIYHDEFGPYMKLYVAKNKAFTKIDPEDYEKLNEISWSLHKTNTIINPQLKMLHRYLIDAPPGVQVDHINRDRLDNRKSNLRLVNNAQNAKNKSTRADNSTGFKGVGWYKRYKKYVARIQTDTKRLCLGYFDCPIEAAKAYDKAAAEIHGEFAYLNFP